MAELAGVPPIEVFQVGSVYFVSDGNHRVSVARASGFKEIEAYVTRTRSVADVDLQPGDSLKGGAAQSWLRQSIGPDRTDGRA